MFVLVYTLKVLGTKSTKLHYTNIEFLCRTVYIAVCVKCFALKPELMFRKD